MELSEAETEKNLSGESTVEETVQEKRKRVKKAPNKSSSTTKKSSSSITASTALTNTGSSSSSVHNMSKSNSHERKIHPKFPNLPDRELQKYNNESEELFCLCRKPDHGELMVGCDGCDDWFHFKCVKLNMKYKNLISAYYCPYCELEGKGPTLFKRKCRLENCFEPISNNETKYCSNEHGVQFMKMILNEKLKEQEKDGALTKNQVGQLIRYSQSFEQFKNLGKELPDAPLNYDEDVRIQKIKQRIDELKKNRELQILRKKLLIKSRENIKNLNEALTAANIDSSDGASTSKSKSKKRNSKKVDICGYDLIFNGDNVGKLKEFDEGKLYSNDTELLVQKFKEYHESDEDLGEDEIPICLLDKRKCLKHNGWQTMINDEIDMNVSKIDEEFQTNEVKKSKIIRILKIDYFESQAK